MDAPTYTSAAAFEQPATAPYVLKLENVSLAELIANPTAWAIVTKHMPLLKLMTGAPAIKPQLGNFTVQSLQDFIRTGSPETFAVIDEELGRLPAGSAAP